jgi:hypothetical protein
VQPLDRPAAGVRQRLDDGRGPHAGRVEQRDQAVGGFEVGAGGGEVLADRLRRRAADDQVVLVAVDHLARSLTSVATLSMMAVAAKPVGRSARAASSASAGRDHRTAM